MLLVKKTSKKSAAGSLNPFEAHLLKTSYTSDKAKPELADLLNRLYSNGYWIICDCCKTPLDQSPGLYIAKRSTGKLYLANLPDKNRSEHAETCVFRYVRSEGGPAPVRKRKTPLSAVLDLHARGEVTASAQAKTGSANERTNSATTYNKLTRILLTLMDDAGALRVNSHFDFQSVNHRLFESSNRLQAWAGKSLSNVLFLSAKRINSMAMQLKNDSHDSAYGVGIFVVHSVDSVKKRLLRDDGTEVQLSGSLTELACRTKQGPFLAIITIAADPGHSFIKPQKAATVPIAANHLPIPVESHLERRVFLVLHQYLTWLSDNESIELEIDKPMFDKEVGEDQFCRPDFIIRNEAGKQLIVEVMGMVDDPAYCDRKKRTHPLMKRLGQLIEVTPGHDDSNDSHSGWAKRLKAAIRKVLC